MKQWWRRMLMFLGIRRASIFCGPAYLYINGVKVAKIESIAYSIGKKS